MNPDHSHRPDVRVVSAGTHVQSSRFGSRAKRFVTVASVALVLAVTGCGSSSSSGDQSSSALAGATANASQAAPSPAATTASEGAIRIGVDPAFAPYIFMQDGQFAGSEADIAQAFGKKLNRPVEFQKIGFDSLIPSLDADRIDMALVGGWADGEKRRAAMNMIAYFVGYSGLLVKKGDPTNKMSELCGKTVSVLGASIYEPALQDASKKCTDAGKPAIDILPLDQDGAILALKSGRADARLDEGGLAGYIASQDPELQMNSLTDFETFNAAMGVSKANAALAQEVTTAMEDLRASGEMATIFTKWGLPADWLLPKVTLNGQ